MKTRIVLGIAAVVCLAFAPAPLPKGDKNGPKAELKSLEGTWALIGLTFGGKDSSQTKLLDMKLRIADGKWAFVREQKQAIEYEMVVDVRGKLPTLDLRRAGAKEPTIRAVYVRKGDTLKLCYFARRKGGEVNGRPSGPDDVHPRLTTMTWRREKK